MAASIVRCRHGLVDSKQWSGSNVGFRDYIGIMENKKETTMMENQMEKKMENEMETGIPKP